jgi:hypothetical protein
MRSNSTSSSSRSMSKTIAVGSRTSEEPRIAVCAEATPEILGVRRAVALVTGFPASVMGSERFAMVGIHSSTKAPLSLAQLSDRAFLALDEADELVPEVVVRPAIPILFFGDIQQYRRSPLRIVTVGLNPSLAEFSDNWSAGAFPSGDTTEGIGDCSRSRQLCPCPQLLFQGSEPAWV